jgi:hypothetical protein
VNRKDRRIWVGREGEGRGYMKKEDGSERKE